jgi:sec-independent protein translocase protein TatC
LCCAQTTFPPCFTHLPPNIMSNDTEHPDPDDMFKDTRMSFGDHIEDLRSHLLRALKGLVIGMVLGFWPLGPYVLEIINAPVEQELNLFEERKLEREILKNREKAKVSGIAVQPVVNEYLVDRNQLAEALGLPFKPVPEIKEEDLEKLPPEEKLRAKGYIKLRMAEADPVAAAENSMRAALKLRPKRLASMGITEMFMVYMKVSFFTGLVLTSPWVFYHLWMFIAAGLYPNEKKLVNYYLPFSLFLFIAGVLLCEFFAMAQAVRAMLWFNEWLGVDAELRLNEWLSFAILMPLVFGLAFQTPLVMMFLHKVGIVTVEMMRSYRRISWFGMALLAALLAPAPDAYSLLLLWVPMVGLYELGILICVWQGEESKLFDFEDEEKTNEMVEV